MLRLLARKGFSLAFGHFRGSEVFKIASGEYLYVGSALAERGATTLARRLLRHATRCSGQPAHELRPIMLRRFQQLQMVDDVCALNDAKHFRWHVDYLLDCAEVELFGVYALRSPIRIEGQLASLLERDLATSIIKKGLGASDVPGNTHLLRVDADELWWRLLPLRMQAAAKPPKPVNLVETYLRGRQCLPAKIDRTSDVSVSFATGKPARMAARKVARRLAVAEEEIVKDAKFALAVDSVIRNCGDRALDAIFSAELPQSRKAVERIARASDVRQRHRVDGVLAGRFRSIAPQSDDPVYDTVKFSEVISRLARAAGQLTKWKATYRRVRRSETNEVLKLADLCHVAAMTLRTFLTSGPRATFKVPKSIERDAIAAKFASISARGRIIGPLKGALKLIVKNVWDHEEMVRRDIKGTAVQLSKIRSAIEMIVCTVSTNHTHLKRPSIEMYLRGQQA